MRAEVSVVDILHSIRQVTLHLNMDSYKKNTSRNYWLKMWNPGKIISWNKQKKKSIPVLKLLRWNLFPPETCFSVVETHWQVSVCSEKGVVAYLCIPTYCITNNHWTYQTAKYCLILRNIMYHTSGFLSVLQLYASFTSMAFVSQSRTFTKPFKTHTLSYILQE